MSAPIRCTRCTRCNSYAHNVSACPYRKSVDSSAACRHDDPMDTSNVTRFEVIDHTTGGEGRAYVKHDVSIQLSLQDDARTLKVFVGDPKAGDAS